jgi:hypothetical protein
LQSVAIVLQNTIAARIACSIESLQQGYAEVPPVARAMTL